MARNDLQTHARYHKLSLYTGEVAGVRTSISLQLSSYSVKLTSHGIRFESHDLPKKKL